MKPIEPTKTYVHNDVGETVTAIGGHYTFDQEVRLPFEDREVLYLVGHALLDTTCCGTGGCGYALVQGFIKDWKTRQDPRGFPVSELAPIDDPILRQRLSESIQKREMVQQVIFA